MHDALDADYFQHAVVVGRLLKVVVALGTPRIGARAPAKYVQNDDALYLRQVNLASVHFQRHRVAKVPARTLAHHLAYAHLQIVLLVVQSTIELVRILFARRMKVKANVGLDADAKVVVHHVDLRVVLIRVRLTHIDGYLHLFFNIV